MTTSLDFYPSVPIANSQLRHLRSTIVGQDYQIKIRLPENYANSTSLYPVLYLLDGDHAFAMSTDIVQYLIYGQLIPDLIIASTAYGLCRCSAIVCSITSYYFLDQPGGGIWCYRLE
jgi:hypothetical protein